MAEGMEADEVFPSRNKSIGKRKKKKSHFSAEMLLECKFTSLIPSLLPTPQIVQHQKKKESEKHGKQSGGSNTAGFVWFQYVTEAEKQVTLVPAT